jgi:hypothetical protein
MKSTRALLVTSLTLACFLLAAAVGSAAPARVLRVPSKADLFAAGLSTPPTMGGGAGVLPPVVRFAPGPGKVLTFSKVAGHLTWGGGSPVFGADGDHAQRSNITSLGGISGLVAPAALFMAGVFLIDAAPAAPAPPRLRVSHPGNLPTIAPQVQQVFFIGDGRTTAGVTQKFKVPPTATRLYLGFVDAYAFHGTPGYYDDNGGSLVATFRIGRG